MGKYYRRRYYSQDNSIKSFLDVDLAFLRLWALLVLLFLLQYIIPVYIYIIEHPIFLIPVGILILGIAWGVFYYKELKKKIRMRAMTRFSEVMKLDWREFEEFVADILKQKWFHTLLWVWVKDGGVDVTATLDHKKFFIQCKHYSDENIWVEKIRELHGVITGELISAGWIFVTTTWFTPDAVSEAHKYGIELWDKNYLIEYLKSAPNSSTSGPESMNLCQLCWGKMLLRTAHTWPQVWKQFLWCENFPKCHFTSNIE